MSQAAVKQVGEAVSQAELKAQLVDCIRMLEQSDIIDYNGHCSIRLDDDRVLINIGSCQRRGTVGKGLVECLRHVNYRQENAYRQYMALQIGKHYTVSEEEIVLCRGKLWNAGLFKRTWDHFRAKLG